jgi:hypothetical protein
MNERGFALPITIFLIAILTLMLGSTFTRAATENQIAGGSKATVDALYVAQAGMQKYLGQDFTIVNRPLSGDSVRLDVQGGYAWIVPEVLQTPADTMDNFRYIIRSTGYATDPSQGSTPLATHTVAQFADWQTSWLSAPPAVLIAANGALTYPSILGQTDIIGSDLYPCGITVPSITGVVAPADTIGQVVTYLDPTNATITGNPNYPNPRSGSAYFWAQQAGIQWDSVVAGAFTPDYTTLRDRDFTGFSSQMIMGDLTTGSALGGSGILIFTGDLDINGSFFLWYGLILVGGKVRIATQYGAQILGSVVTGLNHLLAGPPPDRTELVAPSTRWFNARMRLQYSSCYIQQALSSEKGFIPIENTWIDNWATF